MDQNTPLSQGTMGVGGLERQPDKQLGNKNMTEIYDMLEKYQS